MDLVFAPSEIETWPIARLRPYARNAKMHGDDQVAKIAENAGEKVGHGSGGMSLLRAA